MKKVALSVLMLAVAASGFSQKSMIRTAKNALIEPVDLNEAQKSIEAAMANDETSSNPETYYVAGNVYKAIYDAQAKNKMTNSGFDEKQMDFSLINASASYINCSQLEQVPDAKGKTTDKYDKDLKKAFAKISDPLITEGYTQLQKGNYDMSLKLCEAYMNIPNCPVMREEKIDSAYYTVEYLAINAALLKKDNKTAIKYMMELKDANYKEEVQIYQWLVDAYQAEKDTAKSLEMLEEGLKKHPSDQYMIAKQVNYYIDHGQKAKAMSYLDNAIAANPNSPEYYNVKANICLSDKKFDEALALFEKSKSVDAKNVEAVEGVGVTLAAKANQMDQNADKQKSDAAYKKGRAEAEVVYKQALQSLEAAHSMYTTTNKDNCYWLKVVYNRLGMSAKVKEINAEMQNAK